ncbi:MAG: nucleotidyltransferase family protein, partial [Thermoplasmata archaeon]|nr:nucleotidyltransferase family protein [Thermoplasmata archaeon]
MSVKQAVVMVGGKGTRLLPLTETRPKIVLPVADKPCLWYLLRSLAMGGIEEVILACGYKSEIMRRTIGDGSDLGIHIEYSYEDEPMGTGGAMKLVEDRLDDTFVAANGDVFASIDVTGEIARHQETGAAVTIALTPVENPCEFGIARTDGEGRILEFKEKPKPEEVFSNLINAGVYILQRDVVTEIPENTFYDFSKDLVPKLMSEGRRIQGYEIDGIWMDVGRPRDLLRANLA